jgi:[NiFe] hydrogenase assembly HybE family chaperone
MLNNNLEQLEPTFQMILDERMEGIPIVNEELAVKAMGFHQWNDYQLGILITPWFMNLMLLPSIEWQQYGVKIGSIHTHVFPSGAYDFIVGFEDKIGFYLSCSLFSPMFEFEDQHAAELTAKEALTAIMNDENSDLDSQISDTEIVEIWAGERPEPDKTDSLFSKQDDLKESEHKPISERIKEPTSRRDFLRGKVFSENVDK